MISRRLKLILLSLLFAVLVPAQQRVLRSDWANLNQLAPGSDIRVEQTGGRILQGLLQKVTPESLSMNSASSQEMLSRPDIRRVQWKGAGHRGRNALIGLAIGAGGGLAIGAGLDAGSPGRFLPNIGKQVLAPLGALIGTIVGVALPTGGWREMYRAP